MPGPRVKSPLGKVGPIQSKSKIIYLLLIVMVGVVLVSVPAIAQVITGTISGTVTDSSGAVIPGAKVVVTNLSQGTTTTLKTNGVGVYLATALPPGSYRIEVSAAGFRTFVQENTTLAASQTIRVDVRLQPGTSVQTVRVTAAVPMINVTNAVMTHTVTNQLVSNLPLNGGNFANLVQQVPGVERYPGGGSGTISTNGLRTEDNNFTINGMSVHDPWNGQQQINGPNYAGDASNLLPMDTIQEFTVLEDPSAEYGFQPGAVVQVVVKSGTNHIHGQAYAYGRDGAWDARNYFNTVGTPQTPVQVEQYGATAGGPFIKNKLFWLAGYQGQRYTVGNSFVVAAPATVSLASQFPTARSCKYITSGDCAISIPDAMADLKAGNIPLSPLSLKLATLFPTNNGTSPSGPGLLDIGFPDTQTTHSAVAKVDYHLNAHNSFSVMTYISRSDSSVETGPTLRSDWLDLLEGRLYHVDASWTRIMSSSLVNQARFGWDWMNKPTYSADGNVPASDYGINTGVKNPLLDGLPRIFVKGFQSMGNNNRPKLQGPIQIYEWNDVATYVRGNHVIKFGGDFLYNTFDGGSYALGRGRFDFGFGKEPAVFPGAPPLEDFLAGMPSRAELLVGDPARSLWGWDTAFYATDDWRVTPTLTLNYGLRWEYQTVVHERNNLLGEFDPAIGLVQVGGLIPGPYRPDYRNFAPRVGLAWDISGRGTTVLRASSGIYYEQLNWEPFMALSNSMGLGFDPTGANGVIPGGGTITTGNIEIPGGQLNWTSAGPVFPPSAFQVSCSSSAPCNVVTMDPNFRTPYVEEWSLGIQHSLSRNLAVHISYVGNHGVKLLSIRDINQINPQSPAEIACSHCEAQIDRPYGAKFPFLRYIYQGSNAYGSSFNGLNVTLNARNYHGMTFIAAYTYSHALNDVLSNWGAETFPQNSLGSARLEWGPSDLDMRHRFVLSYSYKLPSIQSFGQLLRGWTLNSIVTLNSGMPWGALDTGNDVSASGEFNDRWDFFGNPSDFTAGPTPIPYFAGASNPACVARATDPGMLAALKNFGCYAKGQSVMIPPALGTFGTMSRNLFRDSGFRNWDFSLMKAIQIREPLSATFEVDFFNILNHPNFANPWGGSNGFAHNDPSAPSSFGCECATPDVAAGNPVFGSGGPREIQLALKLDF